MTYDYKHRGETKEVTKTPIPGWVWLVLGLSIGLFGAFLAFLVFNKPTPAPVATVTPPSVIQPAEQKSTAPTAPPTSTAPVTPPAQQASTAPRFSFYTALPTMTVEIPDEELQNLTSANKVAPQNSNATQDLIDDSQTLNSAAPVQRTSPEKNSAEESATPVIPKQTASMTATPPSSQVPPAVNKSANKYILQVGSYRLQGEAERIKAKLAFAGISANVQAVSAGNTERRYRVRVGPYATQEQADAVKQKLRQQDIQAIVLKIAN